MENGLYFQSACDYALRHEEELRKWMMEGLEREGCDWKEIQLILMNDDQLLDLNQQYLGHDTYTDIITFPLQEEGEPVEAEIYISVERVKENASNEGVDFLSELHRVMAHGLLHLCGYEDKTSSMKKEMRKKEDEWLDFRSQGLKCST